MSPIDKQGHIRTQALGLIRRGDRILVERCYDRVKDEWFCRLLGGTIEFGEKASDTVRRELFEELGAEADVGPLVATIENIFTFEGEPGHEICLVYECSLRDERLYELVEWEAEETTPEGPLTHAIAWKPVESFRSDGEILYPEELPACSASRQPRRTAPHGRSCPRCRTQCRRPGSSRASPARP